MPFFNPQDLPAFEPAPGCRLRTPAGENLMLSYVEMDEGASIPTHRHHHEQGGIVVEGRLELIIGNQCRILEPGHMYVVPGDTPHSARAIDGPVRVLDVFSPVRDDYTEAMKKAAVL